MRFFIFRTSARQNRAAAPRPCSGAMPFETKDPSPRYHWTIEIPDLAALLRLQQEEGELVIHWASGEDGITRHIEIADDVDWPWLEKLLEARKREVAEEEAGRYKPISHDDLKKLGGVPPIEGWTK